MERTLIGANYFFFRKFRLYAYVQMLTSRIIISSLRSVVRAYVIITYGQFGNRDRG